MIVRLSVSEDIDCFIKNASNQLHPWTFNSKSSNTGNSISFSSPFCSSAVFLSSFLFSSFLYCFSACLSFLLFRPYKENQLITTCMCEVLFLYCVIFDFMAFNFDSFVLPLSVTKIDWLIDWLIIVIAYCEASEGTERQPHAMFCRSQWNTQSTDRLTATDCRAPLWFRVCVVAKHGDGLIWPPAQRN